MATVLLFPLHKWTLYCRNHLNYSSKNSVSLSTVPLFTTSKVSSTYLFHNFGLKSSGTVAESFRSSWRRPSSSFFWWRPLTEVETSKVKNFLVVLMNFVLVCLIQPNETFLASAKMFGPYRWDRCRSVPRTCAKVSWDRSICKPVDFVILKHGAWLPAKRNACITKCLHII